MQEIGIWAGSSPSTRQQLKPGIDRLKKLGVKFFMAPSTKRFACKKESAARPYLAGPDREKVAALETLFKRKSVNEIFCIRGGYGTLRLLEYLDKSRVKPPAQKRLWGFSDLTVIQHYLFFKHGLKWVHSPMITGSSFQNPIDLEKHAWPKPIGIGGDVQHKLECVHRSGRAPRLQGLFLGGNLASLMSLMGTRWEPKPRQSFILFLEDIGEEARKLDRFLQQLSGTHFFEKCRAVVTGHFTNCPGAREILKLWAQEKNINLYSGLKAGHETPNLPLPMGVKVSILHSNKSLPLLEVPKLEIF